MKILNSPIRFQSSEAINSCFNCFKRNFWSNFSVSQLNRLLQCCCNSKSLKQGKQIHQQIIMHGFESDWYLGTKLVQMYAECDDLDVALQLFDRMTQRNVFAWTAILSFYLRKGEYEKCLELYQQMKEQGIEPDNYIFPKVLKACAQLSAFKEGTQIHKDINMCRHEPNFHVYNSLIDMYSKCGDVNQARHMFDKMPERNLTSWNSMISGYVYSGKSDLAVELFDLMKLEGLRPDLITWNTIMAAYCQCGDCEKALDILIQMKNRPDTEPNIISWTTLILGYSRSRRHAMALTIFREMMIESDVYPDLDTFSCALASCRHLKALRNGQEIHGYGIKSCGGFGFYDSAGAALLSMYCECRRIGDARNVFKEMDKGDIVTWNAMIMGLVHLGMGDLALNCFCDMQSRGVKPDEITIASLLPACSQKFGKQIHTCIQKNQDFELGCLLWNALMNMYAKCGSVKAAYSVFLNMETRDVVSWNTMIGGYGINGHGKPALLLLEQMNGSAVRPNSVTFTCVLSACSHSGLVDEGLRVFYSMTHEYDLTPTMEHFACIVDMLGRAGRLEEAVDFIAQIATKPDASIWGALLSACQAHQNADLGRFALENLLRLEPRNPGNYVTLSNIYARDGRWEDASRVRKLMETKGLVKPSGYSWFEAESLVADRMG